MSETTTTPERTSKRSSWNWKPKLRWFAAEHARHALLARDPNADVALALDLAEDAVKAAAVPQEIGRVLVALLGNAFGATLDRAASDGTEARVTVSTRRMSDHAKIRVADNGPGIEAEALGRVFEPFYTTKPTGRGHTGLGLSLAHDIVAQGHGGTITAESDSGGATFILTLPAA